MNRMRHLSIAMLLWCLLASGTAATVLLNGQTRIFGLGLDCTGFIATPAAAVSMAGAALGSGLFDRPAERTGPLQFFHGGPWTGL